MISPTRSRLASPAVVLLMLALLAVLMFLQYQWSRRVSEATRTHVSADLRKSILGWHLDLFRNFAAAPTALRLNTEAGTYQDRHAYIERYLSWRAITVHPRLVSNVYIWDTGSNGPEAMLRLNSTTHEFEPAPWKNTFEPLRKRLREKSAALDLAIAGASSPQEFFAEHTQQDRPFQISGAEDNALGGWVFEPEIPALFHPIVHQDVTHAESKRSKPVRADWLVIEYNREAIRDELFPELAQRYFSGRKGLEYRVEVFVGNDQRSLIYSSDLPPSPINHPDARLNIFGTGAVHTLESPIDFANDDDEVNDTGFSASRGSYDFRGTFWFPVMFAGRYGQDWNLAVAHRKGSLGELAAQARRRDLAIGLGILALLVFAMAVILVASRRAQRLAQLQMDFVAGVSHDLRTPLAVMSLAADNLADGLIHGSDGASRYGTMLKSQIRLLSDRVEQVLRFASMERGKQKYSIGPVRVRTAIDDALMNASPAEKGVNVELRTASDLPPALTNTTALTQALENLIDNAIKYGGEDRWLRVRTTLAQAADSTAEIQIAVEDHGLGIEKADLPRVFEPFFRTRTAVSNQSRGSGLGLTLARNTIEAAGGSISVTSTPGQGSCFILHLPCAPTEIPTDQLATTLPDRS